MNNSTPDPLRDTVRWLSLNARFPSSRLGVKAETLLCFAAAAAAEDLADRERYLILSRNGKETSAQRAHAMRRSLVHFKCDNSAKV